MAGYWVDVDGGMVHLSLRPGSTPEDLSEEEVGALKELIRHARAAKATETEEKE